MSAKEKIAAGLYNLVIKKKIDFYNALKIYRIFNPLLEKNKAESVRFTSAKLLGHMIAATNPKNMMAWTSVAFPAEILYPFGIYPVTLEVIAGLFATIGLAPTFLDIADSYGVPNTMCSFHRMLFGISEKNFIGEPSLVAATSILCDGNLKSFGTAARRHNVPFIFVDIPFEYNDSAVDYLKKQLEGVVRSLADITGKLPNEADFVSVARNVNQSFKLARYLYQTRLKGEKNIYQGHEIANFTFPMHFLLGSRLLMDILRRRCNNVDKGTGHKRFGKFPGLGAGTRRIMWLHIVPQYDNDMWAIVDDGDRAKIICDEYSSPYFEDYDESDFLGSVAKRLIKHPANGPIERRIEHIIKVAREYRVDGMIHYSSWGCHQASGSVQLLGRALEAEGYRFLNLNSDPVDRRNASLEQHRTRLEAFLES